MIKKKKAKPPAVRVVSYIPIDGEITVAVGNKIYKRKNISQETYEKLNFYCYQGWHGKALNLMKKWGFQSKSKK